MFSGFTKLTSLDLSKINSSDVTNIYNTLTNDSSLESANLSNFNFTSWGPGSLMYNFGLGSSSIKRLEGVYNGNLALNFSVKEL
jgi:surface protein